MRRFLIIASSILIAFCLYWLLGSNSTARYQSVGGATAIEWLTMRFNEGSFPEVNPADIKSITQPANLALINSVAESPRATWIGHATMLVQYRGINFLTDPHLTSRPAPIDFGVQKRQVAPAISFKDMPKIDFIVISHNHYDHLDHRTVDMFANSVTWYVPMGLKSWFLDRGIRSDKVIELEWWQSAQYNKEVRITFAPSVHWSKRTPWDTNQSHWGSWSVIIADFNTWFGGDTAYDQAMFQEIGLKLGPYNMAFIPIGAYAPRYFMQRQHIDPEQAVMIHQDIKSAFSIPIHWGTFQLTQEPYLEPVLLLKQQLNLQHINLLDFSPIKIGQSVSANSKPNSTAKNTNQ